MTSGCGMPPDWKDFKGSRLLGAARCWTMAHPIHGALTLQLTRGAPTELSTAVKPVHNPPCFHSPVQWELEKAKVLSLVLIQNTYKHILSFWVWHSVPRLSFLENSFFANWCWYFMSSVARLTFNFQGSCDDNVAIPIELTKGLLSSSLVPVGH